MSFPKILGILILALLAACHIKAGGLYVSDILENREKHTGHEIEVIGVISVSKNSVLLCDVRDREVCVNLAVPSSNYESAKKLNLDKVVVQGIYLDHEFKSGKDKMLFLPSRILVRNIEAM